MSPLSPTDTILQSCSLPAALNYSSNMPIWQKPAVVLVCQTIQARNICLSVSPLSHSFTSCYWLFLLPSLSPQLSSLLLLFFIFTHKRHIPLFFIGMRCHSDLLKWMWQAASLVHASYKSHTFTSIDFFFHLISSASVWPRGSEFPSLL